MFSFFSRSKEWLNKEHTPILSSHIRNSPTVIYDYGTRQRDNPNAHRSGVIDEEDDDDNLQYEDEEEEEAAGDEDEDDIDADTSLLPIFSSAFLGEIHHHT